jgi:putative transposase
LDEADGPERALGALESISEGGEFIEMILFGDASLRHVLSNYVQHFHSERNHQGKGNVILFPAAGDRIGESTGEIRTRQRLGGLLEFYYREAA